MINSLSYIEDKWLSQDLFLTEPFVVLSISHMAQ